MTERHQEPELPILEELERDVRRAAHAALDAPVPARRPRAARRRGSRMARRALVLAALALMLGATAIAATDLLRGGGHDPAVRGSALVAARGAAGGGYRLVLHRHGRELCRVLILAGDVTSRCLRAPGADEVQSLSALGTTRRLVFGVTGARVKRVDIDVAGHRASVPTHAIDTAQARASGIVSGTRVFIAAFDRAAHSASQPPALVNGHVDCSVTTEPAKRCPIG